MEYPSPNTSGNEKTLKHFQQSMNIILHKNQATKDLMLYFHATYFSQVKSTLLKTIENNFLSAVQVSTKKISRNT